MLDALVFASALATLLVVPAPTNALLASAGATNGRAAAPLLAAEACAYCIAIGTLTRAAGQP